MFDRPPKFWEEVWQTFGAGVQSAAEIRNRQLGLSSIILSFGKYAQPFSLYTSHIQPQSHRALTHTTHMQLNSHMQSTHTHRDTCDPRLCWCCVFATLNYGRCDGYMPISELANNVEMSRNVCRLDVTWNSRSHDATLQKRALWRPLCLCARPHLSLTTLLLLPPLLCTHLHSL